MNEREVDWSTTLVEASLASSPSTPASSISLLSPQSAAYAQIPTSAVSSPSVLSQSIVYSSLSPSSSSSLPQHPPPSGIPSPESISSSFATSSSSSFATSSSSSWSASTSSYPSSVSTSPSTSSSSPTATINPLSSSSLSSSSSSSSSSTSSSSTTPLTPPPTPPTLLSPCQMTFREAVQNGNTMALQRILEEREGKININLFDVEGQTALHQSCLKGNLELVKLLVKFGADVKLANRDGWNPLHLATYGGHNDIIVFLLTKDQKMS